MVYSSGACAGCNSPQALINTLLYNDLNLFVCVYMLTCMQMKVLQVKHKKHKKSIARKSYRYINTYRDLRDVNGLNRNRIFTVEKRISIFIGRTIFFTSEKFY